MFSFRYRMNKKKSINIIYNRKKMVKPDVFNDPVEILKPNMKKSQSELDDLKVEIAKANLRLLNAKIKKINKDIGENNSDQ